MEKLLNIPPLGQVVEVIRNLPDAERLKLVRAILNDAGKLQGRTEDLQMFLEILKIISATPTDKIKEIKLTTKEATKVLQLVRDIIYRLPADFSLGDILAEFKRL